MSTDEDVVKAISAAAGNYRTLLEKVKASMDGLPGITHEVAYGRFIVWRAVNGRSVAASTNVIAKVERSDGVEVEDDLAKYCGQWLNERIDAEKVFNALTTHKGATALHAARTFGISPQLVEQLVDKLPRHLVHVSDDKPSTCTLISTRIEAHAFLHGMFLKVAEDGSIGWAR